MEGLLRDKTRKSGIPPVPEEKIWELALAPPPDGMRAASVPSVGSHRTCGGTLRPQPIIQDSRRKPAPSRDCTWFCPTGC